MDLEWSGLQSSMHFIRPGVFLCVFRLYSTIKQQDRIQSLRVCRKHVCCVSVAVVLPLGGLLTGT